MFQSCSAIANQSIIARKLIEEIIEAFEERATIEEKYSKSLDKLVGNLTKLEEKNQYQQLYVRNQMFKLPIYCLKSIYASRQHQAEGFHQSLREDLITNLKQMIQQHNATAKKLIEEAKRIERDNLQMNAEVKKNSIEYKQKKREYEQNATVMVVYNLLSEYTEKKRIQQYYKVNSVQKEINEIESKYKQSISDYEQMNDIQKNRIKIILEQLELQEEKRIINFKDALMRQIIFEVSHAKNIQYDLDKITEKLDEIVPSEELSKFVKLSRSSVQENLYEKIDFVPYATYISNSLQRFFQKEYDEILSFNQDSTITDQIKLIYENQPVQKDNDPNTKLYKTQSIAYLITDIWKESEIDDQILLNFKQQLIEDHQLRKILIIALQIKRSQQKFKLTPVQFNNLVKLFLMILDISQLTNDAGTAKQIMVLSFTFHKTIETNEEPDNKPKIYYVQNECLNHTIWLTRDYWETCIIQQIYETIKDQQNKEKLPNPLEQISSEKNLILTILTQMAQNMLLFNFKIEAIKDIMQKFTQFFELNEEISTDLYNAIEGFSKTRQNALKVEQQQQQQQQQQQPEQALPNQNAQEIEQQSAQKVIGKISNFFSQLKD